MPSSYIKRILECRIYDVAEETPIHALRALSRKLRNEVLVKREDLQSVFSFKIRGAYNKLQRLPAAALRHGVIAASAGNHAQGVALAAARRGVRAVIVMPTTTPEIKVRAVRERGAEVLQEGDRFDDALAYALRLARRQRLTFVHPYDDPDVIAGQGTIGMEIVRQHTGPLHALFVPVGGGGLIAGVAAYLKYVRPDVRIVGVECADSACFTAALAAGRRIVLRQVGLFADGTAVAQAGREPFRVARRLVDAMVTVTPDEICAAIKDLFDGTRSIAEPAGALGLAGLKKYAAQHRLAGQVLLTIDTGANINFDRLRYISERADLGEQTEALLAVHVPEEPGSLRRFLGAIRGHDVTEFNYRYATAADAVFLLGVDLRKGEALAALVRRLQRAGYRVADMTDSELVKMHLSHMIGGRAPGLPHEVLYRLQFPERPGALGRFLESLGNRWNITLFHYRKQGWICGDVLVGLDVPPRERRELTARLRALRYEYVNETDNPAYALFMR